MHTDRIRTAFMLMLLGGSLLLAFFVLQPFLGTLALAAIFAVVLHPLYARIATLYRGREGFAALTTLLIGTVIVVVPFAFIGMRVFVEAQNVYYAFASGDAAAALQQMLLALSGRIDAVAPGTSARIAFFSADVSAYAEQALRFAFVHIGTAFSSALAIFLRVFVFFMALYYFLREGGALVRTLSTLSPLKDEDDRYLETQIGRTIGSVVRGTLLIALIQGAIASVGYTVAGVPNAVLWGLATALAALIPGVGTSLVIFPTVAYLFMTGHTIPAIGLFAWGVLVVGLIDNVLAPRLMGRGAALHPLLILLSVLGGIGFFGPIGIFLGPITMSVLIALLSVYARSLKPA